MIKTTMQGIVVNEYHKIKDVDDIYVARCDNPVSGKTDAIICHKNECVNLPSGYSFLCRATDMFNMIDEYLNFKYIYATPLELLNCVDYVCKNSDWLDE